MRTLGALLLASASLSCAEPSRPASGAEPLVVQVGDGRISMSDSVASGWQRLRVLEDSLGHIVVFYRVDGTDTSAIGGAEVGDSADITLYLEPGAHVVKCARRHPDGRRHADTGEQHEFEVLAASNGVQNDSGPSGTASIEMHDFAYTGPERWSSGRHLIRVNNNGHEDHQVRLAILLEGVTLRRWLTDTSGVQLDSTVTGMARIGRNRSAYFESDLAPGRYVMYCLIPTAAGEPHIARGMFREIVVE